MKHTTTGSPLQKIVLNSSVVVKDKVFKSFLIPLLGLLIPIASGLVHIYGLRFIEAAFFGVFFVFIMHLIWQGTVRIISFFRSKTWCRDAIFLKLFILSLFTSLFGACIVFAASVLWQLFVYKKVSLVPIGNAVAIASVAVCIITLIYEAVFLNAEVNLGDKVLQQVDNERLQAEINVLQNELDPHFLFNCLNTLSYLVRNDSEKAHEFVHKLSGVLKYFLLNKQKEYVPLTDEINFLENYYFLLRVRFDDGIRISNAIDTSQPGVHILPCTLQALVENAIKHNFFSDKEPLEISIQMNKYFITVSNAIIPKRYAADSTKTGLNNLKERYWLIMNKKLVVHTANNRFSVKVPFVIKEPL
jgi:sensor histidine kinase YesM